MNIEQLALTVFTLGGVFGIVVMTLNLQYGHTGMVNLGLVAYFAIGAYAYAIITLPPPTLVDAYVVGLALPPWAGLIGAGLAGLVFAALTGPPSLRLRGEYLAVTTFAFAEVLRSLLINERRIGNGTVGLAGIERPYRDAFPALDYDYVFAAAVVIFAFITFLIFRRLLHSPFGRLMQAVRDDEVATVACGRSPQRMRLVVFLLSGLFIGCAGAFYVAYTTFATPRLFTSEFTFAMFVALVLAGVGSNLRALAGVAVVIVFEELMRNVPLSGVRGAQLAAGLEMIGFGLLLIIFLRWRPFQRWSETRIARGARRTVATEQGATS